MRITFILALALCLASCSSETKKIFSPDDLPTQKFTINITQDTTIVTAKGSILRIPKGSITANTDNITLEIKEAFSLPDMIQAGLVTESNGQPLSSGGMIYINAGEGAKIVKPIELATPSDYLDKNMQLYKGEQGEDGNINWTDPKPLAPNEQLASIESGKQIFQANCATCHKLGTPMVGPDLAHFDKRLGLEAHNALRMKTFSHDVFIRLHSIGYSDTTAYYYPGEKEILYACNLRQQFESVGPAYPDISDTEWQAIYDYVQSESNRLDLPLPAQAALYDCVDSCESYGKLTRELRELKENAVSKRNQKISENGRMTENTNQIPQSDLPPIDIAETIDTTFKQRVTPEIFESQYYKFTIESFGWYNIDQLITGQDGVIDSELFVNVRGNYTRRVNLFLIIPSRKVNVEGGPSAKGGGEYAFFTPDGKLPLPQGETCYILAVSEENDEMAYALKSFTATTSQRFDIELQKTTRKEFNKAMDVFNDGSIKIKAEKSKNAKQIRKLDKTLNRIEAQLKEAEKLKPKNCDCDCGRQPTTRDVSNELINGGAYDIIMDPIDTSGVY